MATYKLQIEVLRNGDFFMKSDAAELSELLDLDMTRITRKAAVGGTMYIGEDKYLFRYTGEQLPRKNPYEKPKKKPKPKQSIKKVVDAARKAGMSYGQYVAKMEAEGRK